VTFEFEACERVHLPLWDFGWLDATRYALQGEPLSERPAEVLSGQLRSRVYRNSFAEAESFKRDPGPIHGPFWIDRIEVNDYEALSFDALCDHVRQSLADGAFSLPPSNEQRESVEAFLARIRESALHCYRLKLDRADESYRHDSWLVHTIFHEYVVLDQHTAWLLVVGYD
jgi:hypothetical protein